jgi:prevent-host-death family protein
MNVSIQEFKANLAKYVSQAQAGERIELTSHRKVVAHLTGVPQSSDAGIARLLASGCASWHGGKPKGSHLLLSKGGKTLTEIVQEDRG